MSATKSEGLAAGRTNAIRGPGELRPGWKKSQRRADAAERVRHLCVVILMLVFTACAVVLMVAAVIVTTRTLI